MTRVFRRRGGSRHVLSPTISTTASLPNTVKRGARFTTDPKPLSIATETSSERTSDALNPSSAVQACISPRLVGSFRYVDAQQRLHLSDLRAEHEPQRVDRVRSPRADPTTAEGAVEQPTPRPQRYPGTRQRCASSARARRGRACRRPRARAATRAPGRSGTRSCRARPRPRPALRLRASAASSASSANGLSHSTALPSASARRTCGACRNGGECTLTRSTSGRVTSARTASSSRADTTSTTSQPVGLRRTPARRRAARSRRRRPRPSSRHPRCTHSPSTSGVSSLTGRWKRRSPACVTGPIVNASSRVPKPMSPPRRYPATSALHSSAVRTIQMR